MDFVEAVRLGCERSEMTNVLCLRWGRAWKACIMGAAFLGAGLGDEEDLHRIRTDQVIDRLGEMFPILSDTDEIHYCPACSGRVKSFSRGRLAVHLNDSHSWNRIRTAEYIQNLGN